MGRIQGFNAQPSRTFESAHNLSKTLAAITHGQQCELVTWPGPSPTLRDRFRGSASAQGPLELVRDYKYSKNHLSSASGSATEPWSGLQSRYGCRPEEQWTPFEPDSCEEFSALALNSASLVAEYYQDLTMNKPKIIAYLKPSCGWSQGVRAILRKYDLPYEDRDIINDPVQRQEMIEKSGQMLSPCVEINGRMLPDISGDEVESFLLANNLVQTTERAADAPTNQPCAHEMPETAPLQFRR